MNDDEYTIFTTLYTVKCKKERKKERKSSCHSYLYPIISHFRPMNRLSLEDHEAKQTGKLLAAIREKISGNAI